MEAATEGLPDPAPPPPATRDWSALPLDALTFVFTKLDLFDILMGAGLVCHKWLDAAKVTSLWRCVDMADHRLVEEKIKSQETDVLCAMATVAVDRSGGMLQAFSGKQFVTPKLLNYIGDRAPSLKTLRLINCYIGHQGFAEAIKKFPLLEELDLTHYNRVGNRMVPYEVIGEACPNLNCFRQINKPSAFEDLLSEHVEPNTTRGDAEALAIASMTGLRTLQLQRSNISNKGLVAILDGCPHLDSIDIRQCPCIKLDAAMETRLACMKSLRLPSDPTDDEYKQQVIEMPGSDKYLSWPRYEHLYGALSFEDFSGLEEEIESVDP